MQSVLYSLTGVCFRCDRKRKQRVWAAAVKYLSMNESRVREEVKTINGEECNVWCWIDVSVYLFITSSLRQDGRGFVRILDLPFLTHSRFNCYP